MHLETFINYENNKRRKFYFIYIEHSRRVGFLILVVFYMAVIYESPNEHPTLYNPV